jgi:hypothetical protein
MTDPELPLRNGNFIRRVLVVWVVAVWAVAIGAFLLVLHQPGGDDRMARQQYEPPVAGVTEWDDDPLVQRGTGPVVPQSGSSTAPETIPDQQ